MRNGVLLLVAFAACAPVAIAQQHVKQAIDALGDPLPAGAMARLGSNRFRVSGFTRALAFGPEDRSLVAYVAGGTVVTWERGTGKELRRFEVPANYYVAFSPDGRTLAQTVEKQIRLWDTNSGKELVPLTAPKRSDDIPPVFSHVGTTLAVAGDDCIRLFTWANGKTLHTLKSGTAHTALAFSPDGQWLAARLYNPLVIQLWNVADGTHVRDIKMKSHASFHAALCFAPDSKTLAWNEQGGIRMARVATGDITAEFKTVFGATDLVFTADGKSLIYGVQGSGVHLWNLALKKKTRDLSTDWLHSPMFALSRDGKTLAVGDGDFDDRQVHLFDLAADRKLPVEPGHSIALNGVVFSADGQTLATSDRTQVIFWNARTGQRQREVKITPNYSPSLSPDLRYSVRLANGAMRITDLGASKQTEEIKHEAKDYPQWAAFASDGKQLFTVHAKTYPSQAAEDAVGRNHLQVWDWPRRKVLHSIAMDQEAFYAGLLLTPDGESAITPIADGRIEDGAGTIILSDYSKGGPIHVWNLRTKSLAQTLSGHKGAATHLSVSDDARLLASTGYDMTVRLWELASAQTIFTFPLGETWSQPVALSPDGRLLAAARDPKGERPHIGVWEVASGRELHRFPTADSSAVFLTFSPDGSRLASGMRDATVLLWDMVPVRAKVKRDAVKLPLEELVPHGKKLSSLDATDAHRAAWTLIDAGDEAIAVLQEHVRSANVDRKTVQKLATELESVHFATRIKAAAALVQLGDLAELVLRDFLAANPSLEARRRIEPILRYESMFVNPMTLARLRSIHVLERIGTATARQTLTKLAGGIPQARTTREAAAALQRWGSKK